MVDRTFAEQIIALIASSDLACADSRVTATIRMFASEPLKSASRANVNELRIVGWSEFCSDVVKADDIFKRNSGRGAAIATLGLNNYTSEPRLSFDSRFYTAFETLAGGRISPCGDFARTGRQKPFYVEGLESVMAVQRTPWPRDDAHLRRQFEIDYQLSGLHLAIRVHQAVDRQLETLGIPIPINIFVDTDPAWQDALDRGHLGPCTWRLIAAETQPPAPSEARAKIAAERKKIDNEEAQKAWRDQVAELRELYRLAHMFPFYRYRQRKRIGSFLCNQLALICALHKLPNEAVRWPMPKGEFERCLRAICEVRDASSVEDELDVKHVNELHAAWVKVAKEHAFDISPANSTLFELALAHALKFGGPIVQSRWESATGYSPIDA